MGFEPTTHPVSAGVLYQLGHIDIELVDVIYRPTMALPKYFNRDSLSEAVSSSTSMIQTIKCLYPRYSAGIIPTIQKYISLWELSTSHWTGKGWARGVPNAAKQLRPDEVLVANSCRSRHTIKRVLRRVRAYRCEICDIDSWNGRPLTLQIDHINGVGTDNRMENLRFLCPNCHSQTDTFGGKNKSRQTAKN